MAEPTQNPGTDKIDFQKEEAYWRQQHAKQTYADKDLSYEGYAPAYRTGLESILKYAGKKYEEIEDDIALEYEKARPDSALPWGPGAARG